MAESKVEMILRRFHNVDELGQNAHQSFTKCTVDAIAIRCATMNAKMIRLNSVPRIQ
jgi:predicted metalloenzyme YecM